MIKYIYPTKKVIFMKISEKINMSRADLEREGAITIVAFGDSVTHGAVADGEINYDTVYWNRLRNKILAKKIFVPVNVINSGSGGVDARSSLMRFEHQVLSHSPDLVIICFGLNDVNGELDDYLSSLGKMFKKCKYRDIDTIFLTPNMLNTYVADDTPTKHLSYAKKTADMQNGGKMDLFIYSAKKLAEDMGIAVCDCYSKWKELSLTEDTTLLLANRINHPLKEMHELFASELFRLIFPDDSGTGSSSGAPESTMYNN